MCAQIVKIYPEIEELEQQIEQEKERRREVQARVREEELKIDVLRQAAIKIRRVILHQEVGSRAHAIQKKNNRLRDQSSTQNNRLGRTVHKIGLQEHSNHMFFYHYRKHLFHDHGRAFSPILRGSRERPLSPCSSSGTIVAKRRASSGSVFRHSARPLA